MFTTPTCSPAQRGLARTYSATLSESPISPDERKSRRHRAGPACRAIPSTARFAGAVCHHVGDSAGLTRCDLRELIKTEESVTVPERYTFEAVRGPPPRPDVAT